MKSVASSILIWSIGFAPAAIGGVHIGNGGGLAESNFAYAYLKADDLLEGCLASQALCPLDDQQKVLALSIVTNLPGEMQTQDQIRFRSPEEYPGFFDGAGDTELTARTEEAVGSLIYINLKHIYPRTDDGQVLAVSVDFAVRVLIEQFARHSSSQDQAVATALAKQVGNFAKGRTTILDYGSTGINYIEPMYRPTLTAMTSLHQAQTYLMLADAENAYDLTSAVRSRLECDGRPAEGFTLRNMYWREVRPNHADHTLYLEMAAGSTIRCSADDAPRQGPDIRVGLSFKWVNGKYGVSADGIRVF